MKYTEIEKAQLLTIDKLIAYAPDMIVCIPVLEIIKLIFDRIEPLKPWGFLLGDTMPPLLKIKPIFKSIKNKTI